MEAVVLGQIARDLVLVVDEVPGPGGSADVRRRREMLGGKGANQAVALAQLGVSAGLVGVVGDDEVGARLLGRAERDRIDVSRVDAVRAALECAGDARIVVDGAPAEDDRDALLAAAHLVRADAREAEMLPPGAASMPRPPWASGGTSSGAARRRSRGADRRPEQGRRVRARGPPRGRGGRRDRRAPRRAARVGPGRPRAARRDVT